MSPARSETARAASDPARIQSWDLIGVAESGQQPQRPHKVCRQVRPYLFRKKCKAMSSVAVLFVWRKQLNLQVVTDEVERDALMPMR